MAITITIDNDSATAGIQTLVNDQSADVQTPLTTDTGNDSNIDNNSGTLAGSGFSAAFLAYLNGLGLTDAQKAYAANVDGAVSASGFVTVTTSAGETISNLYFSDASGNALAGQQVAGMTTIGGDNVYLWSNGDFAIATTSNVAGAGSVVAAFYLNEASNHLSAQVQMVTFQALSHPVAGSTAAAYDDALNFTDVLQVSAQGTTSFNFDNLPSGSFLYAAVGSSSAALLVTGQDLNVQPTGPKAGNIILGGSDPSDTVNTSQGGIGATIGINSQHFTDVSGSGGRQDGAIGVFTLVKGFDSFDATMNGTSEGTGGNVNEIKYSDYVNAPSAKIFISQSTGSSSIGGAVKVTLWEAGGGSSADHLPSELKPEEGLSDTATSYSYIGDTGTDSHLTDDTPVAVATVTVQRVGVNTPYTFTGSGGTQGGITVVISGNGFTVSGLQTSDTLGFAAANDPNNPQDGTFNRFDVQALANSNPVDIGRIDLDQGVSISHGIGSDLIVQDDGPSITGSITGAPTPTVDESNFAIDGTGNFAPQFSPNYGTDGQGATPVTYALSTPGGASGLTDTATGESVVLSLNSSTGNVEGKTATTGQLVFIVSVSAAGVVTLDEKRAIVHADATDPNDSRSLSSASLVVLTATAHDKDGDSASTPLNIGTQLIFQDDGPSITGSITGAPTPTVDESNFAIDGTGNFAPQFSPTYGADGQGATPVTYALSTPGGASGLTDTATGESVVLSLNSSTGNVEGKTATTGQLVFIVSVSAAGVVTLDEKRAIVHADTTDPNDSRSLSSASLVVLTATAHDKDGDSASTPLNIGTQLIFQDDGPSISVNGNTPAAITDDESNLAVDNSASYATNFTSAYGADGAGATPVTYAISATSGADSGLKESGTGNHVFLFNESGVVVGRAGTTSLTAASGDIVFTATIDGSGSVTLDQKIAVVHDPNTGADQSTTLSSAGLVVVTATAHDGDGDTAPAGLNIGTLLNFKDDAPTITAQILGGSVAFATGPTGTLQHSLNGLIGADINNSSHQSLSGVEQYTITSWDNPHNVYANLTGVLSGDGTTLIYYSTSVAADQNSTTAVYELQLDQTANSGAGGYTFTVLQPPPNTQTHFDFTDLPSGQNLFGIIATNKADLSQGGLLVFASNPVLDANGMFTNTSGTINTSKGGGPVTIGNGNQAFDHQGEGAYFMYVDNPATAAVGGVTNGLTQTAADDADTIRFNGVNQATDASVTIVQASGKGTTASPGPAMHIFAYEANPGNVNSDTLDRALVNNPTLAAANQGTAAPEVDIVGVKIHDSTGAVIEYRTVNQAAGADNTGTLHGADSAVGITFTLDDPGAAGTGDDIYSALVTNLKAGYTVEFITATEHDLAKVTWAGGSFDIGGFNVSTQSNIPAQDFHFSVQINDYDNDAYGGTGVTFANFGVHVNDLIFN